MNILSVNKLTMSFGAELLYEEVSFGVDEGERVAVVGPNGCGKSTLFRILAGELIADEGEITRREHTRVGYLSQSIDFSAETTAKEVVARAMRPVREAIVAFQEVSAKLAQDAAATNLEELLEEQAILQQRIQNMGGWAWENRVEEMLDRLGVSAFIDEPIAELSGGQRRRVGLARALLDAPDLLLLDEPTNHLDAEAVEWLEGWLHSRPGALLFVTHDRYFMESVADRILEIDDDGFYDYPGNYQTFIERKRHRMAVRERTEQRRQKLMQKELKWLKDGIKSQNTRSKYRVQEIEELQNLGPAFVDRQAIIEIPDPPEFGDRVLEALGVWKRLGEKQLFEQAHISLRPGDKVGLLGPNGTGKTTLLRMLAGLERPDAGRILTHDKTEIAYLAQGANLGDPEATVFEAMGESDYVWIGRRRFHKRDYLNRYLFDAGLQKTPIRLLSGGQKRRLALAKTVADHGNVLILDEPTNDLDMMTLTVLEDALAAFEGSVIVVSHDRYFLNRICTAIVAVEDKKLLRYEGDYDDYRRKRDEELETKPPPKASQTPKPKQAPRKSADLTYRQKQRIEEIEAEIHQAENTKEEIEEKLSDPALYQQNPEKIAPLNRALREVEDALNALWVEWAELEEKQ